MAEKILIFDPVNDQVVSNSLKELGYEHKSVSQADAVISELNTNNYDLLISDIVFQGEGLFAYLEAIKNAFVSKKVPHMSVTESRNVYDISLAETYKVRPIILKPVDPGVLKKAICERLLNRRKGLILCPGSHSNYLVNAFDSMGFEIQAVSKLVEFSRAFHEAKFDFVVYYEGFEGISPSQLSNKLLTSFTQRIPLYFFLKSDDQLLKKLLEKYVLFKVQTLPWDFSLCEEDIHALIMKAYFKDPQSVTEKKSEHQPDKPADDNKKDSSEAIAPHVTSEISKFDETETGTLSVNEFINKQLRLKDPKLVAPMVQYFRTGMPVQRDRALEILKSKDGMAFFQTFINAYKVGNDSLRDGIIDLFTDIPVNPLLQECLIIALNDKLPSIQLNALAGLKNYDVRKIAPHIKAKLRSGILKVKNSAADILQGYKDIAIFNDFLAIALTTEDSTFRRAFMGYVRLNFHEIKDINIINTIFKIPNLALMEMMLEFLIELKDRRVLPYLKAAVNTGDRVVVRLAIEGYTQIPDPSSIDVLVELLNTRDSQFVETSIVSIMKNFVAPKHADMFIKIIEKCEDSVREQVLDLIKDFKEKDSFTILQTAMKYAGTATKIAAIEAMSNWKKESVILLIGPLLEDPDKYISDFVYKYIEENATLDCIESIIKVFFKIKTENGKEVLAHALGRIVKNSDSDNILKLIHRDSYSILIKILRSTGVSLGKFTLEVLGNHITDKSSYEVVLRTLYDKDVEARAEAAFVLGDQNKTQALPHLIKFIDDENWYVRRVIIEALGKMNAVDTANLIIKKLRDPNAAVRQAAAFALTNFKVKFKEPILTLFMEEESLKVLEQMTNLLAPFRDLKTADVYLPKLSASNILIRINAAANLLSLWGATDKAIVQLWLKSDKWAIRLLALSYCSKEDPGTIMNSMNVYIMDHSDEIRRFLISFIASQKKEECVEFFSQFVRDESSIVRLQILTELKKLTPPGMAGILLVYAEHESNETVLNLLFDILKEFSDPELSRIANLLSKRTDSFSENIHKRILLLKEQMLEKGL